MTLLEWRKTPDKVRWARQMWNSGNGRDAIMALINQIPYDPGTANGERAHGRVTGYMECLHNLMSLPVLDREREEELVPTYDEEQDYGGRTASNPSGSELD